MEQHPIPRNVSGFQFQLIGSMTLKQFGYLAGGFILAFISFKSPLSFLKFPLVGLFAFLGFALAFFPIQERPLDIWILNFLKSVYSPTQFLWQKENKPPEFLTQGIIQQKKTAQTITSIEKHQEAREKLFAYLQSVTPAEHEVLDEKEKGGLGQISSLFAQKAPASPFPKPPITTQSQTANLVSGLVKSQIGVLPNIIINIKDKNGGPVRILKSDKQGKFSSKLPLTPGVYFVEIEDLENKYAFERFGFKVNGQVIKPWLIIPKLKIKS